MPLYCHPRTENDYVNLFGPQKNLYFFQTLRQIIHYTHKKGLGIYE